MATVLTTKALLGYSDAGVTWTDIGRVISVTPPKTTINAVPTGIDADSVRVKVAGVIKNVEDVSATIEFDKTEYTTLFGLIGTSKHWHVKYRDTSEEKWQGFITSIGNPSVNADSDDVLTVELTIACTTKITYTAAT